MPWRAELPQAEKFLFLHHPLHNLIHTHTFISDIQEPTYRVKEWHINKFIHVMLLAAPKL